MTDTSEYYKGFDFVIKSTEGYEMIYEHGGWFHYTSGQTYQEVKTDSHAFFDDVIAEGGIERYAENRTLEYNGYRLYSYQDSLKSYWGSVDFGDCTKSFHGIRDLEDLKNRFKEFVDRTEKIGSARAIIEFDKMQSRIDRFLTVQHVVGEKKNRLIKKGQYTPDADQDIERASTFSVEYWHEFCRRRGIPWPETKSDGSHQDNPAG